MYCCPWCCERREGGREKGGFGVWYTAHRHSTIMLYTLLFTSSLVLQVLLFQFLGDAMCNIFYWSVGMTNYLLPSSVHKVTRASRCSWYIVDKASCTGVQK